MAPPLVRWEDDSFSDFGSPISAASTSKSQTSTGSLTYINSQLVSHGFLSDGGLSLDGLGDKDMDKVIKCLLKLLSQRMEDVDRSEQLSAKFRTLTYDFERLSIKHREEVERAANAEKEMNLHKSKLSSANRTLQSTVNAHKTTTAELQRTRTSLTALRSTHQAELRKRDKEAERMVERWAKLADQQLRAASLTSNVTFNGSRCANAQVHDGLEVIGQTEELLETALEDAERARSEFMEENSRLRRTLVRVVNEAQAIVYELRILTEEEFEEDEPPPVTTADMFPLTSDDVVGAKFTSLFASFKRCISTLSDPNRVPLPPRIIVSAEGTKGLEEERERLEAIVIQSEQEQKKLEATVNKLKTELVQSRKETAEQEEQTHSLLEKLVELERVLSRSLEDDTKEQLAAATAALAEERARFSESTSKMARERAELEADRRRLEMEREQWESERKYAPKTYTLPDDDGPEAGPAARGVPLRRSPRKTAAKPAAKPAERRARSPGKPAPRVVSSHSPAKAAPAATKKGKRARRPSLLGGLGGFNLTPSKRARIDAPFETEYIAPREEAGPSSQPLMTSEFVLPPPSPNSKIVHEPALFTSTGAESAPPPIDPPPLARSDAAPEVAPQPALPPPPKTPGAARPFPLAKPLARNMVHAYSPAKPSPLSRILSMKSPESPDFDPMSRLDEEDSGELAASPTPVESAQAKQVLTVSELGLIDEESPLRDKRTSHSRAAPSKPDTKADAPKSGAQDRGKARPPSRGSAAPPAASEKESGAKRTTRSATSTKPAASTSKPEPTAPLKVAGAKASSTTTSKPVVAPRRVPVERKPFG